MRLNQAASNALMARLEAQKAICDSSERELHRKFKHRDELETLIRPEWEQARKRSRMSDESSQEKHDKAVLYLPGIRPGTSLTKKMSGSPLRERGDISVSHLPEIMKSETPSHKELRVFLEEEQKASEAGGLSTEEVDEEHQDIEEEKEELDKAIVALKDGESIDTDLQKLRIEEDEKMHNFKIPAGLPESQGEEDEESRKQRGKGNLDKWLQILLDDSQESSDLQNEGKSSKTDEIIRKLNLKYPTKVVKVPKFPETINVFKIQKQAESSNQNDDRHQKATAGGKKDVINTEATIMHLNTDTRTAADERGEEGKNKFMQNPPPYYLASRKSSSEEASFGGKLTGRDSTSSEKNDKRDKGKGLARSESFSKSFRRSPSSPSIILGGMRKGVDCMRKKPLVMGDEDREDDANNFSLRSSFKSIKKSVKI